MTREEELWAAIIAALNGDDVDVPVPAWRREEFLVGILGAIKGVEGATVPEPVWREEQYLKAMFDTLSGGAGSSYKLLKTQEFDVNTTSTSETNVGAFIVNGGWTKDSIIYVKIRDKAGKRNGYFLGSDCFHINYYAANDLTSSSANPSRITTGVSSSGMFVQSNSAYGVYLGAVNKYTADGAATIAIRAKYSSGVGTINGTYVVEVYALSWPKGDSPFK